MQPKFITSAFLLLSTFSGMVELGCILLGLTLHLPLLLVVIIGLAYQIGNLVPVPVQLNKAFTIGAGVLALLCLSLAFLPGVQLIFLCAGYSFLAMSLQSLRAIHKSQVSPSLKRSFRILGFLLAPLLSLPLSIGIALLLLPLACLSDFPAARTQVQLLKPRLTVINWIMIVHQMHYFSYGYFIVCIIYQYTQSSVWLVAFVFILGWISYTSLSHLLRGQRYMQYFVLGHTWLALILILLGLSTNGLLAMLLWILTGFGGGTVFCLEKINERTNQSSKEALIFSENIGHILGVALGILAYQISQDARVPVFCAACCAAGAMCGMLLYAARNARLLSSVALRKDR